jgi:hypothetical protein
MRTSFLALAFAQEKTEGLQHLQPFRAGLVRVLDQVGLGFGIPCHRRPWLHDRLGEHDKTARMRRRQFG